jgi:hypothetical protein
MASVGQASMALTAAARSGNVEKVKALLNEGEPTDVQITGTLRTGKLVHTDLKKCMEMRAG